MKRLILVVCAALAVVSPASAQQKKEKKAEDLLGAMQQRSLDAAKAGETHEQTLDSIFDNQQHGDGSVAPTKDKLLSGTAESPQQAKERLRKEEECRAAAIKAARSGKKKIPRCGRKARDAR